MAIDWKVALPVADFTQECSNQGKIFFYVISQHWCKATIFSKLSGFFSKIKTTVVGQGKEKKLQLLKLSHMVKTGPK